MPDKIREIELNEKQIERFNLKYNQKYDKCWIWKGIKNQDGYGSFNIGRPCYLAHRIMWTITFGPIPKGLSVLHKCDVRACVNPEHLFLGTQLDNIKDRTQKGRSYHSRGELSGCAKLTNAQAEDIRKKWIPRKYPKSLLAKEYGVSLVTIKNVVYGKTYVSN